MVVVVYSLCRTAPKEHAATKAPTKLAFESCLLLLGMLTSDGDVIARIVQRLENDLKKCRRR